MSDQDTFEQVLVALHEAMLDDTYWPTTSALIDEACGATGNGIMLSKGPKDDAQSHFFQLYYRGEPREDLVREYLELYYPIDESTPRLQALPNSRVVHITELYTAEELKTSAAYNESVARANAQSGLNVRLDGPDGFDLFLAFADPVTRGGWESSQLAMVTRLLPHLRQFVRVRQALVGTETLGMSVTDLLDASRLGVIHLDQRGRVTAANDRARRILRHGGLSDRGGELRARNPAAHAHLERLVAGALPSAGVPVSGSLLLRRSSGILPVVVHVKPVVAPQLDYRVPRVAVLVLLVEPGHQARIDPAPVATVLGLTRAESQIAVALAQGQTVRDVAGSTGRQVSSIHWHLKRTYRKLGITRQAELVEVVRALIAFA